MPPARDPNDFLADITVLFDGVSEVRSAPLWSRDKLGILAMYLPAFASACHLKAPEFYFVDGLAGPGLYHFEANGTYVLGSTLIALNAEPKFSGVVALELGIQKTAALRTRAAPFGDRATVEQGDCNKDLLPLMRRAIPDRAPLLVLLDPEGLELEWHTVEEVSKFRQGARKAELLILVPTGWVGRAAEVQHDYELEGATKTDFAFPLHSRWRSLWAGRKRGELTAAELREQLADDYAEGLARLGYAHTDVRGITHGGREDADVYHLVFASDHDDGLEIMDHVFRRMYSNPPRGKRPPHPDQGRLF